MKCIVTVNSLQIVLFHPYTLRLLDNPCLRHINHHDTTDTNNILPIYEEYYEEIIKDYAQE